MQAVVVLEVDAGRQQLGRRPEQAGYWSPRRERRSPPRHHHRQRVARDRVALRLETPQLVWIADCIDARDATLAHEEQDRGAIAIAVGKH